MVDKALPNWAQKVEEIQSYITTMGKLELHSSLPIFDLIDNHLPIKTATKDNQNCLITTNGIRTANLCSHKHQLRNNHSFAINVIPAVRPREVRLHWSVRGPEQQHRRLHQDQPLPRRTPDRRERRDLPQPSPGFKLGLLQVSHSNINTKPRAAWGLRSTEKPFLLPIQQPRVQILDPLRFFIFTA